MSDDMPHELGVLCVGETMSLLAPEKPVALERAERFTLSVGGAESNVAMHLAGLGHRAGWASKVGDDPFGRRLLATIAATGVDTGMVETHPHAPTGVYFKNPGPDGTQVHYYRSGSAASTMEEHFLSDDVLDAVEILHLSGITPALSAGCDRMAERFLTRPRNNRVAFDVNYRSAMWPVSRAAPRLRELARHADIVFVGLDEAETLWGVSTPEEVREVLDTPTTVVVKDAANAASALGRSTHTVPAPNVQVIEPVGAGDAFAAGYLSGVLRGLDEVRRLRLGHLLAAYSLLSTSDHMPAPANADLVRWLEHDERDWRELRFGSA